MTDKAAALALAERETIARWVGDEEIHLWTFNADGKARMLKMVDALEVSLDQDIKADAGDESSGA